MNSLEERRIKKEEYKKIKEIAEKFEEAFNYEEYYIQPADLKNTKLCRTNNRRRKGIIERINKLHS